MEKVTATKISGDKLVNDLLDDPEPVKSSLELMINRWDEACKASETRQNRLYQALLVRARMCSLHLSKSRYNYILYSAMYQLYLANAAILS